VFISINTSRESEFRGQGPGVRAFMLMPSARLAASLRRGDRRGLNPLGGCVEGEPKARYGFLKRGVYGRLVCASGMPLLGIVASERDRLCAACLEQLGQGWDKSASLTTFAVTLESTRIVTCGEKEWAASLRREAGILQFFCKRIVHWSACARLPEFLTLNSQDGGGAGCDREPCPVANRHRGI
jgi:hypothetical protein